MFGAQLHPSITIGTDRETAAALEKMGARHRDAAVTEAVVDVENRLVTTPCYMSAKTISQVAEGAQNAVDELLKLVDQSTATTA